MDIIAEDGNKAENGLNRIAISQFVHQRFAGKIDTLLNYNFSRAGRGNETLQ